MTSKPFVLLSLLLLIGYPALVAAQPSADLSTTYTTPSYLGGSISVKVGVHNLGSVIARVSRVEVTFDWSQTFTGNVPIMIQPGESYQWSFPDCAIPGNTWAGKHSYDVIALITWADSSGGWGQDITGRMRTDFNVEQQPPPQVLVVTVTQETLPPSPQAWSEFLPGLLILGLVLVGAIVAIRRQKPQTSSRNEPSAGSQPAPGAVETTTSRECKACHNINPPYATKYCVRCGSKLE